MKKRILAFLLAAAQIVTLSSFKVDETFSNTTYNQKVFLYNDGSCVVVTENGRGTGTYDLSGGKIYISWDNGAQQQGSYSTNENGRVNKICIEGVCYESARKVVSRRRR